MIRTGSGHSDKMEVQYTYTAVPAPGATFREKIFKIENYVEGRTRSCAYCTKCSLHKARAKSVYGDGSLKAPLMIISEAPSEADNGTGLPFSGPSGKLLDECLLKAGLTRQHVYMCNLVKCRPVSISNGWITNRSPNEEEIEECSSWLTEQVEHIKPKVILALGALTVKNLIGREVRITRDRGMIEDSRFSIPVVAAVHPAYILRLEGDEKAEMTTLLIKDIMLAKKTVQNLRIKEKELITSNA